jgi:hypothetical protein
VLAVAALVVLAIAAALAWFGHALAYDRNGLATRTAANLIGWRLDRPADEQPRRLAKSFRNGVRSQQGVGVVLLLMALLIAAAAISAAVHAL